MCLSAKRSVGGNDLIIPRFDRDGRGWQASAANRYIGDHCVVASAVSAQVVRGTPAERLAFSVETTCSYERCNNVNEKEVRKDVLSACSSETAMVRKRKTLLLLLIFMSVAMQFDGCAEQPIYCAIRLPVMVDKAGHSYGYHDCRRHFITGACILSIQYIDGPYAGMVFRLYDDKAGVAYIRRATGERYYLRETDLR